METIKKNKKNPYEKHIKHQRAFWLIEKSRRRNQN